LHPWFVAKNTAGNWSRWLVSPAGKQAPHVKNIFPAGCFMADIIVSCAGCGKRYKGTPGARKFKCSVCLSLLTFPETPRTAPDLKLLCSCCWQLNDLKEDITNCVHCGQKVIARFGGKAAVPATSSGQALAPVPEEKSAADTSDLAAKVSMLETELAGLQKAKREADAKISELLGMLMNAQTSQATMRMERDRAVADAAQLQIDADQARAEMEHFRASAVAALEPLSSEYNKAMKEMMRQATQMLEHARQTQEEANQRMDELAGIGSSLSENINSLRKQFRERISMVLGSEAEMTPVPIPRENLIGRLGQN
jgi:hypothetical protein